MSIWSLERVLGGLHEEIQQRLDRARGLGHPVAKGDASETIWIELLNRYLPERYRADRCFVVDSKGAFSQQMDVVIFDRQYTPFIANFEGQKVIPAESVYAVFEAKQRIDAEHVDYAQLKAASVRALHRTSLPAPTNAGIVPAKDPHRILAGLLTFESTWTPPMAMPLVERLRAGQDDRHLDLGCVAAHGTFRCDLGGDPIITTGGKPATAFLLELIAQLQTCGTVPMIDVRAYARWLEGGA